ncbi:hypothetical protein [Nocardiopsis sp. NPDC006832]|uniref:hypothetical protein n=1 Tax=Nocardiopsis sp. NPDC006832 TaxID=3157188 RepID=UPI0033DC16A5
MAFFVHLTPRANIALVQRSGVRTSPGQGNVRGVFCFPMLPSYAVTHQWLHALEPHHEPQGMVAVDVRIPDDEPVTVGHFDDRDARRVTALEAVRVVRSLKDPGGWEVVVPRPVLRREVERIREVGRAGARPLVPEPCAHTVPTGPPDLFLPPFPTEPPVSVPDVFLHFQWAIPEQVRGD